MYAKAICLGCKLDVSPLSTEF